MTRVAIGIPSTGMWYAGFGASLAKMMKYTEHEIVIISKLGSALSTMRTDIVLQAQQAGCTHLLFLDSDMVFQPSLLDNLIDDDVEVVAANCPVKMVPSHPTARKWDGEKYELVLTNDHCDKMEQVDRIGTGVMLIRLDIIPRLATPWFAFRPFEAGGYQGEDWCFCEQVEAAGIPIWIDHDVSKDVGHIGYLTYTHKMVKPEMLKHPGGVEHRRWEDSFIKPGGE